MSKLKKLNVSEVEGSDNSIFPSGTVWIDQANTLRISDGVTQGGQALNVFDNNGNLVAPSGLAIGPIQAPVPGTQIFQNADGWIAIAAQGTDGVAQIGWAENPYGGGKIAGIIFNDGTSNAARINVGSSNGTVHQWTFDDTGRLTLPAGGDITDSNGSSVLGGGSTGTVTFVDNVIEGDSSYVLGLSPHPTFTDGTWTAAPGPELGPQYLRVRGGDNYEHIHFDTSNNSAFDLYVGDDYKYFKLSKDGPAVIGTSGNVNHTWSFGTDAILTLPSGAVIDSSDNNVEIRGMTNFNVEAEGNVSLLTDSQGTGKEWLFGSNGDLTVPGNSQIISATSAGFRLQSDYETPMVGGPLDGLIGGGVYVSAGQISVNYQQNDGMGESSMHQWDFNVYGTFDLAAGGLRFNDDTTQTTAFTGTGDITFTSGRIISASSIGLITFTKGVQFNPPNNDKGITIDTTDYSTDQTAFQISSSPGGPEVVKFKVSRDGAITFSDATVQTTAWTGGRVVTAPTHSTGAVGDTEGDLAFDDNYLYYCIADYGQVGHQVTVATAYNGATSLNTNSFQLTKTVDTEQITVGDTISDSDGGATSTVVTVSSDENYTYVGTGGMAYNAVFPLTFTSTDPAYVPGGNIWVRVAWSGSSW